VIKTVGSTTTVFVYDAGGRLAAEYGGPANPLSGTTYLTGDHLGSTRMVTNAAGAVVSRYDYAPLGEELTAGIDGRTAPYSTNQYPTATFPVPAQILGVATASGGLTNATLSPTVTQSYLEVKSGLSASSIGKGVDQAVATAGAIGAAGLGSKAISVLVVDSKAWGSLSAQQRSAYAGRATAAGAYIQVQPGLADAARKRAQKLLDETRKDQQ